MNNNSAQFDQNTLAAVKPGLDSTLADVAEQTELFFSAPTDNVAAIESARTQMQSLMGVLKMVGLNGLAVFCAEIEVNLNDLAASPQQFSVLHRDALRKALFGVTHFLDALVDGASNAPLRLFSEYQELQQLRGMEMSFELDLFSPNLAVELPQEILDVPLQRDAAAQFKTLRGKYQQGLLKWLRQNDVEEALRLMQSALGGALSCAPQNESRAFWWVAQGLLECLKQDAILPEMNIRKMLGRIDQQLRSGAEGQSSDVDSVLSEMLFMIGLSQTADDQIEAIQRVYALSEYLPKPNTLPPGEVEQLLGVMRDQLRVAEENWELSTQGDAAAGEKFVKYVDLLAQQSEKLDRDVLQYLAKQIQSLSEYASSVERARPIAMDMAMSLLLLGSGIDNYNRLGSGFQAQAGILAGRMQAAVKEQPEGVSKQAGDLLDLNNQMEQRGDLMGPLAHEMLVNLQHVEQGLNSYFGEPLKRDVLVEILRLLSQIQGGLRISSLEHAATLLASVQECIHRFSRGTDVPKSVERYALADSLSALENYMQYLTHGQSGDVWRLQEALVEMQKLSQVLPPVSQTPETQSVTSSPVENVPVAAGVAVPEEVEQPQVEPDVATLQKTPEVALTEESVLEDRASSIVVTESSPNETQAPTELAALSEEEQELLEIFLEEAGEVLATISNSLKVCQENPDNHDELVAIRRGFHTLKGSGRMVGLNELGEVAWCIERAMNAWLQENKRATPGLLALVEMSVESFVSWVEQLSRQGTAVVEAEDIVAAAQQLEGGAEDVIETPTSAQPEAVTTETVVENIQVDAAPEVEAAFVVPDDETSSASALFNIASAEVKENARELRQQLDALQVTDAPVVHYDFMRAAHTLAGVSRTMNFAAIVELAAALEGWLSSRVDQPSTLAEPQLRLLGDAITALDEMIQCICQQQEPPARTDLVASLLKDKGGVGEDSVELQADFEGDLSPIAFSDSVATDEAEPISATLNSELTGMSEEEKALGALLDAQFEAAAVEPSAAQHDITEEVQALGELLDAQFEAAATEPADKPSKPEAEASDLVEPEFVSEALTDADLLQPVVLTVMQSPSGDSLEEEKSQVFDEIDDQLLPVFLEEAEDLVPKIAEDLQAWREKPQDEQLLNSLKRLLHTLKGSSRMVGAMRIGEIAHAMESQVEGRQQGDQPDYWVLLDASFDHVMLLLEELRGGKPVESIESVPTPARRAEDQSVGVERRAERRGSVAANMLRVRSDVVDKLVNEAGEISVTRSRMEAEVSVIKNSVSELTASVTRLRQQLREIEIQAESQMQARVPLVQDGAEEFDPLEFDRFSRLQELTRFMTESVHDVQTVQQSILRNLDEMAAAMIAQGRVNRELQQGLMNVRMVSFNSIADRLYRIVRQTGKELNKRANLELLGTNVELDRSVLEKMVAPFEHLLRNSLVHGLEDNQRRAENGKLPIGEIRLSVRQENNEVLFEFSDDGAGLDYARLKEKAVATGELQADEEASEGQLAELIFKPGLSTATEVTEVAGRGIGMDVVRSEIATLGGRIDVSSRPGEGTQFSIRLPLTLAVTQVLMVQSGEEKYAIPSVMVEQVRQVKAEEMAELNQAGQIVWQGEAYPLNYLPRLLGAQNALEVKAKTPLLLLRSGNQRIALQVDGLLGNQEAMVKNIGPQLSRMQGIAGATILGDGSVVLIINPTQMSKPVSATREPVSVSAVSEPVKIDATSKPSSGQSLIMVVDDSLTVRKITSRMLIRAGYEVVTATDGIDALEKLKQFTPEVMLLDIEMPRMDGFALARELRRDPKTHDLPIIMITSRTADKHREYAMQLGVNTYMGKPYQEDDLLQNITDFVAAHKLDG